MGRKIVFLLFGFLVLFTAVYFTGYDKEDVALKSPELDEDVAVSDLEEKEIVLNGVLEIVIYDEENPRYEYFLDNDGKKTQVWFDEPVFLAPGSFVKIKAELIGGKVTANKKDLELIDVDLAPPVVARVPETIGEQRTAVILVRFNDSTTLPFTVQQINDTVFKGVINNFIRENSFNKTWLKGNTYGWYTMNRSCNSISGYVGVDEAISLADLNIYFPNIDRIIIISDSFCTSIPTGVASLGKTILNSSDGLFSASYARIRNSVFFYEETQLPSGQSRNDNFTSGVGLTLHELIHGFGVGHSNNLECGLLTLGDNCSTGVYGNIYDVMGKGAITGTLLGYGGINFEIYPPAAFHLSGLMKREIGWVNTLDIVRNGTYILRPLEKSQASTARVSLYNYPASPPYFLEYRIPFGYDFSLNDPLARDNLGGIFINRQSIFMGQLVPEQSLLDMNPLTSDPFDSDWYNVSLNSGETFFDVEAGIKISNVIEDLSNPLDPKISFNVEFYNPICSRENPLIYISTYSSYTNVRRGNTTNITNSFYISGFNSDSMFCSNSPFEFYAQVPNGWNYTFIQPDIIVPAQQSFNIRPEFLIGVPSNVALGSTHNVSIKVFNPDSGLSSSEDFRVRVI